MTILAHLEPGPYGENRVPNSLAEAQVGLIFRGRYFLISACRPDTLKPAQVQAVRNQIASILSQPTARSSFALSDLARTRRAGLFALQSTWNDDLRQGIARLRQAPILINIEQRSARQPLSEIRLAERGIGDHALTIFDTGETFVFDQSHIFFDGAWGAGLAEILTREALSWAVYLSRLPEAAAAGTVVKPLRLPVEPIEVQHIELAPKVSQEVSAETEAVQLKRILSLRRLFKQRSDLLNLTVNDLLVLYRAIHTASYRLAPSLHAELTELGKNRRSEVAAQAALEAFEKNREIAPAILIPIDATQETPRERIYPLVFEVPLQELDLLRLHRQTLAALDEYEQEAGDRSAAYAQFDHLQREYLATLAGLSEVLNKAKEVGVHGSSASVETIKLLAYMPAPVQRLLDKIPNRFDILNDLIKGREIFSNVGVVAPGSTLRRFVTAKDDNEKKSLAWGVLTDAGGVMRITLRDFRPHVTLLQAVGHRSLAVRIAQHYLDTYAQGLNEYVYQVRRITHTSRETYLLRSDSGF
jgi:hypothetical protein